MEVSEIRVAGVIGSQAEAEEIDYMYRLFLTGVKARSLGLKSIEDSD